MYTVRGLIAHRRLGCIYSIIQYEAQMHTIQSLNVCSMNLECIQYEAGMHRVEA